MDFSGTICLIIPPSPFLLDERVFPFLGILRIAAVLRDNGISVEVLDLSGIKNYSEVVLDYRREKTTEIFGITTTTPQLPATAEIVRTIRSVKKPSTIILGGPHVTLVNAAYRKELEKDLCGRGLTAMYQLYGLSDVLVAGDGEEAIFSALDPEASHLIDADDIKSGLFLTNEDLNLLPFPAREMVDLPGYRYSIDGVGATSLIAQLGCPFRCSFCGGRSSPALRKIRTRTSENIVQEIIEIYRTYGHRGFMFYDDELNVNKQMVDLMKKIHSAQQELGVEWRLRGFIKSELFTDDQAEAMYKAGFRWILVGFESGSPRILKAIEKNATREQNTRCLEIARKHGLKVKALMSIGHAGESRESVMETRDWLLACKPDDFDLSIITCYPGTPYYDEAVPHPEMDGVWVYKYPKDSSANLYQREVDYTTTADYYKGDPNGGYVAHVFTDDLSSEDLVFLRDSVEREVRQKLGIPFNPASPGVIYEHSMGQSGIPSNILRSTSTTPSL